MRLKVSHNTGAVHAELVSAVSWEGGTLLSGSDDQTVQRWSADGQHGNQVRYLSAFARRAASVLILCKCKAILFRFAAWVLTAQTCILVQHEHRAAALRLLQ